MIGCFAGFVIDVDKLLLMGSSLSFAVITLLILKKFHLSTKLKLGLIYGHLVFLFFPLAVLTTDVACSAACMPCANNLGSLAAIALPSTLLFSTLAGFFVIPGFYMLFSRKAEIENVHVINFIRRHSAKLKMSMPKMYIVDNVNPVAFSFRSFKSMVFLSAGLMDILNKKELESVLLHELGHIRRTSSVLKMSVSLLRFFSPLSLLARFHHDSGEEEMCADRLAARLQKTGRHLKSAKRKIDRFERYSS